MSANSEIDPAELAIAMAEVKARSLKAARLDDSATASPMDGFIFDYREQLGAIGSATNMLRQEKHVENQQAQLGSSPEAT